MEAIEEKKPEIQIIGDEYINQVRSLSSLGYTPERICNMLQLSGVKSKILSLRMSLPGDTYNSAYQNGRVAGEYNIDAELAKKSEKGDIDAITLLQERKDLRNELDLRKELFGI